MRCSSQPRWAAIWRTPRVTASAGWEASRSSSAMADRLAKSRHSVEQAVAYKGVRARHGASPDCHGAGAVQRIANDSPVQTPGRVAGVGAKRVARPCRSAEPDVQRAAQGCNVRGVRRWLSVVVHRERDRRLGLGTEGLQAPSSASRAASRVQ